MGVDGSGAPAAPDDARIGRAACVASMAALGFVLWAAGLSLSMIIGTDWITASGKLERVVTLLVLGGAAVWFLPRFLRRNRIATVDASLAASAIALPGMMLDGALFLFAGERLLPPSFFGAASDYAGWSLLTYAAILVGGLAARFAEGP